MDIWENIPEFPEYLVSHRGLICNDRTGRIMRLSKNQHGVVYVGLVKQGVQYKRAVAQIVATTFLGPPPERRFDTPMHLNGNREHNFVENLVWRPRAFCHTYYSQLVRPYQNRIERKIVCIETGEVFDDSLQAAMRYGLLERSVVHSILNEDEFVWPMDLQFRVLEE